MRQQNRHQHLPRRLRRFLVGNSHRNIQTCHTFCAVIDDIRRGHAVVWNHREDVIPGSQPSGSQGNFDHFALLSVDGDPITDTKRPFNQQSDTGNKIGESRLRCKANSNTDDAQTGDNRHHIKTELGKYRNHRKGCGDNRKQVLDQLPDGRIHSIA